MKNIKYIWLVVIGAFLFSSCEPEVEETITPQTGTADFSNYVALGNSLTAGFADGGLYAESQELSYPNMIAAQIAKSGGSASFLQPTIPGNGSGYITFTGLNPATGLPILGNAAPDPAWTTNVSDLGPFNNLGVPGIRMLDVTVDGYGAANPYYGRMIPSGSTTNYLSTAAASGATFFTMWLGNNDVLGYATSGGAAGVNGAPGTFLGGITPEALFQQSFQGMLSAMTSNGAKGVVANIPSVTDIPYFTTIPYNALPLSADQAAQLNAGYAANITAGVTEGARVQQVIPVVVSEGVKQTQVIPTVISEGIKQQQVIPLVISEGVRLNEVIPAVITEGVIQGQIIPGVVQGVVFEGAKQEAIAGGADEATADGIAAAFVASETGQAQIAALQTAYLTAYNVNSDNPQVTDSGVEGIEQSTFDIITAAVAATLQDPTVQAEITAFVTAYSVAYLANSDAPVATAPFTQEQFDAVTAATNLAMASNEVVTIITAFNTAYLTAYAVNPVSPQVTDSGTTGLFTQEQFDTVTATVNEQMASNPEVLAGIAAFNTAYLTAYAVNPVSPQVTDSGSDLFSQEQFDAVTTNVNDAMANNPEVLAGIEALLNAYLTAYAVNPADPQVADSGAAGVFTQEQFDAITANTDDQMANNPEVAAGIQAILDQFKSAGFFPVFQAGANPWLIQDPSSPTGIRLMRSTELVLLTLPTGEVPLWLNPATTPFVDGDGNPLVGIPSEFILTDDELANLSSAVSAYNSIISSTVAATDGVELFDANALFSEIVSQGFYTAPNGVKYDYNAGFVTGGIFSLDGVHATPLGYSIVANEMITKINSSFNATIPRVDIENFRVVKVSGN